MPFNDTAEPTLTDAQEAAALFNAQYNIYKSNLESGETIEVSAPDGSDRKAILSSRGLGVNYLYIEALMGDKLVYRTSYSAPRSKDTENHYYVLNLATGEQRACTEIDALLDKYTVGGYTSDAVYLWKEKYVDDVRSRVWTRMDFSW